MKYKDLKKFDGKEVELYSEKSVFEDYPYSEGTFKAGKETSQIFKPLYTEHGASGHEYAESHNNRDIFRIIIKRME